MLQNFFECGNITQRFRYADSTTDVSALAIIALSMRKVLNIILV